MTDETFHPLVFWWIAFYKDGSCLPQFDLETGKENPFISIDQNKLEKFGLFPFNQSLAIKASMVAKMKVAIVKEGLPYFMMQLKENQRLISIRRNYIHLYIYQHCNKCGYDWQWMSGHKEGEVGKVGLIIHQNNVVQEWKGKKYGLAVCPKCDMFNSIICPECKDTLINELKREDSEEHYFKCPKCNKEYPRYIQTVEDTMRMLIYILGYQTTIDGKNVKHMMFINENGTFEMNNDFNYNQSSERLL
jgi:hypothetical protein